MYRITNILQTPQRKKLLDLAFFMIAAPQNGYALTEICNFAAKTARIFHDIGVRAKKMGYRRIPILLTLNLIL